jgi:hypothetical protein
MPDVSANADPGTAGQFTASISGSTMTVTSVTSGSNISPGMALINASSLTYLSRGSSYLVIVGTSGTTKAGATGTYTVMTASCLSTLLSSNPTPTASLMASTASTCMTGTGGGGTSTFTQTATSLYGYMQSPVPYYVNGVLGYVGGTSEATPMWAGIVAQMASNYSGSFGTGIAGWKSLIKSQAGGYGFNNYLYSSGLVGSMINDVTLGTNFSIATGTTTSACAQFCTADVGWDAVTGLGSPNVTALINNLK